MENKYETMSLPPELTETTIDNMQIGEQDWTVPWAMFADTTGHLWLNGHYPIDNEPRGETVCMHIRRQFDGFVVDVTAATTYRWTPGEPYYVGGYSKLPVVDMIR